MKKFILSILLAVFLLNLASAVVVDFVETSPISPGDDGTIRLGIENNLNGNAEDVSISLDFSGVPFIPLGTSEYSVQELEEDEDETFLFRIKASFDVEPGDYEIPYVLSYLLDDREIIREGSIGVRVEADPQLSYSIETTTPVVGRQGQLTLKIVNKGFSSARFVSVQAFPEGFTLLSDDEVYIGEIDSDDFETAGFDVNFNRESARFHAVIEYRNFENELVREIVNLPVDVYTEERAVELGLVEKSTTFQLVVGVIVLVVIILIWRSIRRKRRKKKSLVR